MFIEPFNAMMTWSMTEPNLLQLVYLQAQHYKNIHLQPQSNESERNTLIIEKANIENGEIEIPCIFELDHIFGLSIPDLLNELHSVHESSRTNETIKNR
jgi:hypothetical protein